VSVVVIVVRWLTRRHWDYDSDAGGEDDGRWTDGNDVACHNCRWLSFEPDGANAKTMTASIGDDVVMLDDR